MGKKSQVKREAKQAKKLQNRMPHTNTMMAPPSWLMDMLALGDVFDGLETPTELDDHVNTFCASISPKPPFYIDSTPELWSRDGCCDLNVAEYAKTHGGETLYGYRIWYNKPSYIEAERHAIWTDGLSFRDVSFVVDGTVKILFLPDVEEKQQSLESNQLKIRKALDQKYEEFIESHRKMDPVTLPASSEVAWKISKTYEEWVKTI